MLLSGTGVDSSSQLLCLKRSTARGAYCKGQFNGVWLEPAGKRFCFGPEKREQIPGRLPEFNCINRWCLFYSIGLIKKRNRLSGCRLIGCAPPALLFSPQDGARDADSTAVHPQWQLFQYKFQDTGGVRTCLLAIKCPLASYRFLDNIFWPTGSHWGLPFVPSTIRPAVFHRRQPTHVNRPPLSTSLLLRPLHTFSTRKGGHRAQRPVKMFRKFSTLAPLPLTFQ